MKNKLIDQHQSLNPLALHRQIENLLAAGHRGFTLDITLEKEPPLSLS